MSIFLEKYDKNSFLLRVNVKSNSKKQALLANGEFLTIAVRSKAVHNKANKELLNLLKKKLTIPSNQIHITSGLKNRNKIILLTFLTETKEEEIIKKLIT